MKETITIKNQANLLKSHQVEVLCDDYENADWEMAHFALFIGNEVLKGDTRWLRLLRRAKAAYRRGDEKRFNAIIDEMRKIAE